MVQYKTEIFHRKASTHDVSHALPRFQDGAMFSERLDTNLNELPPAERTLAAYIQANLDDIAFENGESLARKMSESQAQTA